MSIREGHSVLADDVVLATATPIHHNLTVHSRQNPYRTFTIALTVPKVSRPLPAHMHGASRPVVHHQQRRSDACVLCAVPRTASRRGCSGAQSSLTTTSGRRTTPSTAPSSLSAGTTSARARSQTRLRSATVFGNAACGLAGMLACFQAEACADVHTFMFSSSSCRGILRRQSSFPEHLVAHLVGATPKASLQDPGSVWQARYTAPSQCWCQEQHTPAVTGLIWNAGALGARPLPRGWGEGGSLERAGGLPNQAAGTLLYLHAKPMPAFAADRATMPCC